MKYLVRWLVLLTVSVLMAGCGGGGNPLGDDTNGTDQNQTTNTPPIANAGADKIITEGQAAKIEK